MREIKWLFFDIGSTLVDESACYRQRVLEMICGSGVSYEDFMEKMRGYYERGGKGDKQAAAYYGFQLPEWKSELEVLYPEVRDCLPRLHARYKLGIIANQNVGTKDRLRGFGILNYFDVIASSAEEGVAKPDQRLFEMALERADCPAENAMMIGDRLDNDIAPAKALGMTTVRLLRGFGRLTVPSDELEVPQFTMNDLNGLCAVML